MTLFWIFYFIYIWNIIEFIWVLNKTFEVFSDSKTQSEKLLILYQLKYYWCLHFYSKIFRIQVLKFCSYCFYFDILNSNLIWCQLVLNFGQMFEHFLSFFDLFCFLRKCLEIYCKIQFLLKVCNYLKTKTCDNHVFIKQSIF